MWRGNTDVESVATLKSFSLSRDITKFISNYNIRPVAVVPQEGQKHMTEGSEDKKNNYISYQCYYLSLIFTTTMQVKYQPVKKWKYGC